MAQHPREDGTASDPSAQDRRLQEERTATDKVSGNPHALLKPVYGAEGSRTFVTPAAPFPVTVSVTSGGGGGGGGAGGSPLFARIDQSTTSSTEIVAAVVGKKIRVVSLVLFSAETAGTQVSCVFLSATTEIAGPYQILRSSGTGALTSPLILLPDADGYFETVANEALNLVMGSVSLVGGSLVYIEV